AHLEILRQKQVYVLLRDIADANDAQVVIATHSEVILNEALDNNLTLLIEGRADDLAKKQDIRNSLKHFGAEHYLRARECGYVFYVEGHTDVDMLHALAKRMRHPVASRWDERINSFCVQNNYSVQDGAAELERVEGGFGMMPREHFNSLRNLLPDLAGLAILDNDGQGRQDQDEGKLKIRYWRRYECENYFVTPDALREYALRQYPLGDLFEEHTREIIDKTLAEVVTDMVFDGSEDDYQIWRKSPPDTRVLLWETKAEHKKFSLLAEEFFRRLAQALHRPLSLRKNEFYQLVEYVKLTKAAEMEIRAKLDLLMELFECGNATHMSDPAEKSARGKTGSGETLSSQ
ncbi:MAG: hypothetical protein LBE06_07180, partial [Azoarcus sp.]|nr:hypothetical protein [Azoarcus sp.]